MHCWLLLLPFVSAALGWGIHRLAIAAVFSPVRPRRVLVLTFQGLLPRRQGQLAAQVGQLAVRHLPDPAALQALVANPAHFEKLRPLIEEQIEHFLRVKLKQSMPMIAMFIGDKTINQLKGIFVAELEELFPVVMQNYAAQLTGSLNIETLVREKLAAIPPEQLVAEVRTSLQKELAALQWLGAITGFCCGLLAAGAACL
jgi:uncharacterized membrane protein YheB (UPF0754 family)